MKNETKIGIFAVIVVALSIWGYEYLKGKNYLTTSTLLKVEYTQIDQLKASSPIFINGFQVGVVSDLRLKETDMHTIVATLNLDKGIDVPKNAIAQIVSTGFMGGKAITLEFDQPCQGDDCAQSGDYLRGTTKSLLDSMVGEEKLEAYMKQIRDGMIQLFDTLSVRISDPDTENSLARSLQNVQEIIASLKSTTANLDRMMASGGKMDALVTNFESISGNIASNNDKIDNLISNTESFTAQLKDSDLKGTINKAGSSMDNATEAINQLKTTLDSADKAVNSLSSILTKMENGEGTLGMLLTDDTLYYKLSDAGQTIESFLRDLEEHPYRYIPLKSRRKVMKYDRKDGKDPEVEN